MYLEWKTEITIELLQPYLGGRYSGGLLIDYSCNIFLSRNDSWKQYKFYAKKYLERGSIVVDIEFRNMFIRTTVITWKKKSFQMIQQRSNIYFLFSVILCPSARQIPPFLTSTSLGLAQCQSCSLKILQKRKLLLLPHITTYIDAQAQQIFVYWL